MSSMGRKRTLGGVSFGLESRGYFSSKTTGPDTGSVTPSSPP